MDRVAALSERRSLAVGRCADTAQDGRIGTVRWLPSPVTQVNTAHRRRDQWFLVDRPSGHAQGRRLHVVGPVDDVSTAAADSAAGNSAELAGHTSVLIVDDQRLMAEGLASLLRDYPGIDVRGWVETAGEALAIIDQQQQVDVVIVDAQLGTEPWSRAASSIRARQPRTAVVVVNAVETDEIVLDAVEAGVAGLVWRSESVADVAAAVRAASTESVPLPARTLAGVLARQRSEVQVDSQRSWLLGRLTPREHDVLELMVHGLDNRAMAAELGIGYSTVRSHVRGVLEKLGTHSRLEAVALANRINLLHDEGG
jgi:DNA-binding NarL/FixJ family response regulator